MATRLTGKIKMKIVYLVYLVVFLVVYSGSTQGNPAFATSQQSLHISMKKLGNGGVCCLLFCLLVYVFVYLGGSRVMDARHVC